MKDNYSTSIFSYIASSSSPSLHYVKVKDSDINSSLLLSYKDIQVSRNKKKLKGLVSKQKVNN